MGRLNGCNRVATTGMSALAVAQTVARATGNQVQVMDMLKGVNATIGSLIAETGKQLNTHVDQTAQFASNPMIGIETMQNMFDQTFRALCRKHPELADVVHTQSRGRFTRPAAV